jgi:hypothetical protein
MSEPIRSAPLRIAAAAMDEVALTFEEQKKLAITACSSNAKPTCDKKIKVGIFFDGTNNNRQRDKLDRLGDRPKQCHSNIVSLYEAHKDVGGNGTVQDESCYSFYMPGVGTRFEEGREYRESMEGKAMAKGGQARILFAVLQVYNAIHRAFNDKLPMLNKYELADYIKKYVSDMEHPYDEQRYTRPSWFAELTEELEKKIAERRKILPLPHISSLKLSVFGFSRGAVQARAFCYWFQDLLKDGQLAGIPASIMFLGLYDSVASVGLSRSVAETLPVPGFWADGHNAWASEVRKPLPPCVEQCVHYIAAHEQRMNFPVTRVRGGNIVEVLYPGVHSDVGGGYGCRDQGRALSPENRLSQVPLLHMYKAALLAGAPLVHYKDMSADLQADFDLGADLVAAWNGYMKAGDFGGSYEAQVREHMRLYYAWRGKWLNRMDSSFGVVNSNEQDKEDLLSYNELLRHDLDLLRKRDAGQFAPRDMDGQPLEPRLSSGMETSGTANFWQMQRYDDRLRLTEWERFALRAVLNPPTEPQPFYPMLERFVHDSLAGFWMAGYLSDEEKAEGVLQMVEQGGPPKDSPYRQQVWQRYQDDPELEKIIEEKQAIKIMAREAQQEGDIAQMERLNQQSAFSSDEQARFARLYPAQTDANAPELRDKLITTQTHTRREGGGYFHPRFVFD